MTGEKKHEPTIAPGMNTHDELEEKPTEEEIEEGEFYISDSAIFRPNS